MELRESNYQSMMLHVMVTQVKNCDGGVTPVTVTGYMIT